MKNETISRRPKKLCFLRRKVPKAPKWSSKRHPKWSLFLESNKTTESCSRLHAELVFEVWRAPKPHFSRDHFRKPSSCCTGAVVSQIFVENDAPESVQNPSKILFKMKQETTWKNNVKSGGGSPPKWCAAGKGGTLWGCANCILQCWRRLFLGFRYISAFSAWVHPL